MSIKKTTKDIVGSSMILGVGGASLQAMGQGSLVAPTIGKGASMMGAVVPASYGIGIIKMLKPKRKRRK